MRAELAPNDARALLERHGGPRAVFDARAITDEPDWSAIERDLDWLGTPGHHFVTWGDDAYPALLADITDAPIALFVAGDPSLLATPALAIVGSRNPTRTGVEPR